MKFALQVNSAPYSGQGSEHAYGFARAAIAQGHEIDRVFFYFDGVYNALALSGPPDDEKNIVKRWSRLAEDKGLDLVVCVSAAMRRGIELGDDRNDPRLDALIARGFRISGLGQWVEAAIQADRVLVFGD